MTPASYQQSMIDLSLENGKLITIFNDLKTALLTRLKGDRGQKVLAVAYIIILSHKIFMNVQTLPISTIKS